MTDHILLGTAVLFYLLSAFAEILAYRTYLKAVELHQRAAELCLRRIREGA
jgi:hypothetical protein